jgi:hypothetical protein
MVPTERDYDLYKLELLLLPSKQKKEIESHNSYYGRKEYYPNNLDKWAEIGKQLPKKHAEEKAEMEKKLKEMRNEIDEHNKKLMEAATKGPQCAVCLENKYAEEGPNVAVSFGPGKCRKHIFHEGCVKDGRVSRCPLCRGAKKALKRVDMKKLSKLASPIIKVKAAKVTKKKSPTKKVVERKRCPNGTRKNKKTGECEKK